MKRGHILLSFLLVIILFLPASLFAQKLLIPMDFSQTDHLNAYVVAYWCLS